VTRSAKLLIPAILALAAAAAFWFLVVTPKRERMAALDTQITAQQSQAAQAEQQLAGYKQAKADYKANYTKLARLGKAVPADDDVRSLLVQLDDTAKRANITFQSLNVGSGSTVPAADTAKSATGGKLAPPPGTVPVGTAGFSAMPFSFEFTGSFFRLSDFFSRLEKFVTVQNDQLDVTGRLLLLGNISLTPQGNGLDRLKAEVGAAAYIVPPTTGVAGATPPTAPATTPGTTTPPAGTGTAPTTGAAPTTSATITGVR
jgi:hypothetical protein